MLAKIIKIIMYFLYVTIPSFFVYTGIEQEAFCILLGLLGLDTLTGVFKSARLGKKITSRIGWVGPTSKFLMLLVPFTLALVAKGLGYDWHNMMSIVMGVLIIAEGYSIIGNIYSTRTGKETAEQDAITIILTSILGFINGLLEEYTKKLVFGNSKKDLPKEDTDE